MGRNLTSYSDVWINQQNGWAFEASGDGSMMLNRKPVFERPDWATGLPHYSFGPMVQWRGGDCPLPPSTVIRAHFRGRLPYVGPAIYPSLPAAAKRVMWRHAPCPGRPDPNADIVAYQVAI